MDTQPRDLLQDLADRLGCTYISDLKFLREPAVLRVCIKDFPAEKYSIQEWNQAIRYLTGNKILFPSANEARQYLIECKLPRLR